jgi:prepilin-type N-terminal cleavage/methylation domain-containing protein
MKNRNENRKRAGLTWEAQFHRLRRFIGRLAGSSRAGFTLAEITTTVAVIGVITAIAVPNFMRIKMGVNMEMVKQNLKTIHEVMNDLFNDNRQFPDFSNLGNSEEEQAIAANLTAIDLMSDYTITDYRLFANNSSYSFTTCPRNFQTAGDKCFVLSPSGISEIAPLVAWDGSNVPMFSWDSMRPNSIQNFFSDPDLSDEDRLAILTDYLEYSAYQTLERRNYYKYEQYDTCRGIRYCYTSDDDLTGIDIFFNGSDENALSKYNEMIPNLYENLKERGIHMYEVSKTSEEYQSSRNSKDASYMFHWYPDISMSQVSFEFDEQPTIEEAKAKADEFTQENGRFNLNYWFP